ncbi:MAG: beta-ketoacyl-ACP synthase II, partial [Clostridia bacterium]|nr:beta-ketoacyl-ACP synthase II [Clostridia bacterium]
MNKKLVVTGMGAVTPLGIGVDEYWSNLISGKCAIDFISKIDVSSLPVKVAAEVRGFDASKYLSKKLCREADDFMQYSITAALEAIKMSGLDPSGERIGVTMGAALDGISTIAETQSSFSQSATGKVSPRFIPKVLGNIAASLLSIETGIMGPSVTVNTACSSGADAVTLAAMFILAGDADAVIAMGGESSLSPVVLSGLASAQALCREAENPSRASRPFDLNRAGFVMGEGGGALVLESEEHAKARGAHIYAYLAGYANNTDAYHVTAPEPEGTGAARCIELALSRAGIDKTQVDYINAHGTSTKLGDAAETKAVKRVFGAHAYELIVSSTKGATGHLMGAGGITESIACIKAINDSVIPPQGGLEGPGRDCERSAPRTGSGSRPGQVGITP